MKSRGAGSRDGAGQKHLFVSCTCRSPSGIRAWSIPTRRALSGSCLGSLNSSDGLTPEEYDAQVTGPVLPSPAPTPVPKQIPKAPPARGRPTAAPTSPPIKPPTKLPPTPQLIVFARRTRAFSREDLGARESPFPPRTLRVVAACFPRLHGIQAGNRLFRWSVPPQARGTECSTSQAPTRPEQP